jgi:hypothetical protein
LGRLLEHRAVSAGLFVLYAALTLWVALHHEPWLDEADTWLLMRDAPAPAVLQYASYGGTPLLFHALIWPFARTGFPYLAQQLVALGCAWAAVWLLLHARAFPAPVRLLFPFSFFPSFDYSVIARPYALFMLLLFVMAALWRTREQQPLRLAFAIALLANVTVHGLLVAAVAGLLLLIERRGRLRRYASATAITVAGGLLSAAQVWPRVGGQVVARSAELATLRYVIAEAFFPDMRLPLFWPAVLVFLLIAFAVSRRAVALAILLLSTGAMLALFLLVWMGGTRHAGLLFLLAIAALWIADAYGALRLRTVVMTALAVSLVWSVVTAYDYWTEEVRFPFSGGRWMAAYIREHGLETAQLGAGMALLNPPLVDLPRTRIWYPERREWGTYATWAFLDRSMTDEKAIRITRDHFSGQRWYLLSNREVPDPLRGDFRLLARSPLQWGHVDERYWLYEPVR